MEREGSTVRSNVYNIDAKLGPRKLRPTADESGEHSPMKAVNRGNRRRLREPRLGSATRVLKSDKE